jgi:hypothetical protein
LVNHKLTGQITLTKSRDQSGRLDALVSRNLYYICECTVDDELAPVNLRRDDFHGEWIYTILPRLK